MKDDLIKSYRVFGRDMPVDGLVNVRHYYVQAENPEHAREIFINEMQDQGKQMKDVWVSTNVDMHVAEVLMDKPYIEVVIDKVEAGIKYNRSANLHMTKEMLKLLKEYKQKADLYD